MAATPDTLLFTKSTELNRMSVDMLTLTDLGWFGVFLTFSLSRQTINCRGGMLYSVASFMGS